MSRSKDPLIYVIDKNASYRKVISGCLEALQFNNYQEFSDGEQCFTSGCPEPDVIILDYNLGENNWNGIEFMEEYSRVNKNSDYLFLSSHIKLETAVKSIRLGAFDYILKSNIGLSRLVKQLEKYRFAHRRRQKDKTLWNYMLFTLIFLSTCTIVLSVVYTTA
jgi:two-component system response regulator AtoC